MNYNNVLNALESYLTTLTPIGDTLQQALHAIIVLGVPLYWKGTSYKIVSASWCIQKEILRLSAQPGFTDSGKTSRAANLYLRVLK